ncbi:JmjC domain-containing protein [Streptomyces sp. NPDC002574]|uniref:JmjC domain-containing protein n=1 Tax=Streptomyces sp. NPDC002574 TaxID=3364652 RepID=UPI00369DBC53
MSPHTPAATVPAMESSTLAGWVGDVAAFTARQWQRRPAAFTPEPGSSPSPFGLEELDSAFDAGLLRTPYLEMVRSDKVIVPPEAYTTSRGVHGTTYDGFADRAKVLSLLGDGATLLLRRVDQWHPATGELVARLSAELDRRVEAFFFVTPAGGQGLAVHRDDADVFVLQAAGRKTWYVHGAPAVADWAPGELADDEHSPRLLRTVLGPGSALYIPRGFAHRAVGAAGLSAHLSLTVRDINLGDLRSALEHLVSQGLSLPALPLGEAAIAEAGDGLLGHYRARLEAITPQDLLAAARYRQELPPAAPERPRALAEAARTWEPAGSADTRAATLASVGRTWRRLRDAARPAR